jgi:uncharacterized protein (TIGR02246 family)
MRLVAIVGAFALMTAPALAQQKGTAADEAAIAKLRTAYQSASSAQNAAEIARLFAADGIEMPPNAPAASGRAAIEALHKGFAKQWMMHGITITPTSTKIVGAVAYDVGTYKQQLMSQANGSIFDDKGKYVVLLKKDAAGNWAISHAIYNSDLPPPAAAAPKK